MLAIDPDRSRADVASHEVLSIGAWLSVSLIPAAVLFALTWHLPFRIEGDVAYVAKAAQQYASGIGSFNSIQLVDPADLSRSIDTWLFWWPPAIYVVVAFLLTLGLSLATAGRLMMLAAATSGLCGWVFVSRQLGYGKFGRRVAVAVCLLHVVSTEMFSTFSTGDPVVFGIAPWLFAATFSAHRRIVNDESVAALPLALTSLALGGVYWVKYSSVLASGAMVVFLAVSLFKYRPRRSASLFALVSVLAFSAPVASLWAINHHLGGDIVASHQALLQPSTNLLPAFVLALGSSVVDVAPGLDRLSTLGVPAITGITAGLGLMLAVLWIVLTRNPDQGVLGFLLVSVPIAGLLYLNATTGYHFLLDAVRHMEPYWLLFQLYLGTFLLARPWRALHVMVSWATAVALLPALYRPWVALRTTAANWKESVDGVTGLYYPTLTGTDSGRVVQRIRSCAGPNTIVIVATYSLGMEIWLAFPGTARMLPLTTFYEPLVHTHGLEGANYAGRSPFRASAPEQLLLVAPDPYRASNVRGNITTIRERFAGVQWHHVSSCDLTDSGVDLLAASAAPRSGE